MKRIRNTSERLNAKTLDQMFINMVEQGYDCPPGISHRVEIVRLYIERKTYTEIERRMKHSLTAIKRYIVTFSRVAYLTEKSYSTKEIAFLVQISERLARDYQALYRQYNEGQIYLKTPVPHENHTLSPSISTLLKVGFYHRCGH